MLNPVFLGLLECFLLGGEGSEVTGVEDVFVVHLYPILASSGIDVDRDVLSGIGHEAFEVVIGIVDWPKGQFGDLVGHALYTSEDSEIFRVVQRRWEGREGRHLAWFLSCIPPGIPAPPRSQGFFGGNGISTGLNRGTSSRRTRDIFRCACIE